MGKKILFVTPYPKDTAPSQRLRFEAFYAQFEAQGFQVEMKPFVSYSFWNVIYTRGNLLRKVIYTLEGYLKRILLLFSLRKYDLVYIHLWVVPFAPPIFEWLFTKIAKATVYDIDDMLYVGDTSRFNKAVSFLKSKSNPLYLLKNCDHVIVSTKANYDKAKELNKSVTNIPVCIDVERYKAVHKSNDKVVVGWTGSRSTSKYLYLLKPVFEKLVNRPDVELLVIGDQDYKIDGVPITALKWSAETEVSDINRIDVGLYPLPDEKWVLGKGGGKALQYMSLEIPVIATAVGENLGIIDDGINGFLIQPGDTQQWYSKIQELIESKKLRLQLGKNGRKKVEHSFSIKANVFNYISVFDSLI
ncbi:glycosyltransferase family 4 protein [Fulvivirga sp. 29W222]|uniref:Glycosyltransferase family 4 protein n=1 Tax=Fulvivirga marina TaxID=2494733 RepID=A0A937FVS6_9BACT|nr:glycosyltransferase family 4 protein [Fulvivirga marina]MBL6446874.1 glycosyltransferase family 4 protein [Fulvivirga marina]